MKDIPSTDSPGTSNLKKAPRETTKGLRSGLVFIILWTVIVLVLLLAPITESSIPLLFGFSDFDKVVHFVLFAISGLVNVLASGFLGRFRTRVLFGIIFGLLLATGTEFIQSFIPTRDMSLYDLVADIFGLIVAIVLSVLIYRIRLFTRLFAIEL